MKIFGYNNFSTVRTPFNGTIDAIDRPVKNTENYRANLFKKKWIQARRRPTVYR